MKFINCFFLITLCFFCSCATKFSVKYNDIDSAVRVVNPDHNCNCDYGDKAVTLYNSNNGKRNLYYWQVVYLKNANGIDLLKRAKDTKSQLIKLVPELANYRRFYIEFRQNNSTPSDSVFKWNDLGTAFFIDKKCEGYKAGVTAKELIKKSHSKKFEAGLCK